MRNYVGIDGCKGGWILCYWNGGAASSPYIEFVGQIDLLNLSSAIIAAIDIPIGFLPKAIPGGRAAEQEARRFLPRKTSSVFSAPCRDALKANSFEEAISINRMQSQLGTIGLSRQCAAIIPKMREIDDFITPEKQGVLVETHPEVAFAIMNGDQPVLSKKRKVEGQVQRRTLLKASGFPIENLRSPNLQPKPWSLDDVFDACACAWVAKRVHLGEARKFPHGPSHFDARGLRMEINA